MSAGGNQFLHRLSRLFAENSVCRATRGERVAHFWQSLSATIIKEVVGQLRQTTYTGPQGPVLPALPIIDAFGNAVPRRLAKRARGNGP